MLVFIRTIKRLGTKNIENLHYDKILNKKRFIAQYEIQAYLRDSVGLVPDYHNKAIFFFGGGPYFQFIKKGNICEVQ